jgi:hypothetical protein
MPEEYDNRLSLGELSQNIETNIEVLGIKLAASLRVIQFLLFLLLVLGLIALIHFWI